MSAAEVTVGWLAIPYRILERKGSGYRSVDLTSVVNYRKICLCYMSQHFAATPHSLCLITASRFRVCVIWLSVLVYLARVV